MEDDERSLTLLQEFRDRFHHLDLRKETKKGTSVYNGIFNLLVLNEARDWITGKIPQYDDLNDHHIVPAWWGKTNLKNDSIHTILNRTPLSADTNRNIINDRLPNEYLPELIGKSSEQKVREILDSHFISSTAQEILLRNPFGTEDYEAFISDRQRTFLEAIENLLIKERLKLSLPLRELDEKIEKTELMLRKIIVITLDNEPERLPEHLARNIRDTIQRVARKNAIFDIENYKDLSSMLKFADLRELYEIICSKTTWLNFEERFNNKAILNTRFDQLCELRNSIRHSRDVNDITRKDGEVALLWFNKVLNKSDKQIYDFK